MKSLTHKNYYLDASIKKINKNTWNYTWCRRPISIII